LTLDLILKYGGFEQGMDRAARTADKRMKEIEARALKFGKFLGGALAAGATAAVAGLVAVTKQAIDAADRLNDISQRLGVSTEALSAWGYAAQQSGTDLEALNTSLTRFTKNVAAAADADSRQGRLFESLGVDIKDANGNLRSVESLLPQVADKFKELNNATLEAALAQELFGRSGGELLQFLNLGSDGIAELTERARDLGIIVGQETATAADNFNDTLNDLSNVAKGLGLQVATALLPELTKLLEKLVAITADSDRTQKFMNDLSTVVSGSARIFEFAAGQISVMVAQLAALKTIAEGVIGLDWGQIKRGIAGGLGAQAQNNGNISRLLSGSGGTGSAPTHPGVDFSLGAPLTPQEQSALERRLNGFLANPTGAKSKKSRSGKSDAEREAEQLKAAYDRMNESLAQQVALFGQDGEAARVRYEIEHGELVKLSQAEKDSLIAKAEKLDMLRAESEVQKALDETNKRREEGAKQVLEDIQTERDLLGQTIEFQDTYIRLKRAGVEANSAWGQSIVESNHALHEEAKAIANQVELMDTFRTEASNALADVVSGTKSLSDAFKDMFDNIAQRITQMIADRWIEQMFGEMGSTGGGTSGGGWLAAIAGLFGGGKASGGWTSPNTMYEVNERGFEMATVRGRDYMLTGSNPVHITPNHQLAGMGGGVSLSQTFVVQGTPDNRTREQMARTSGREAARGIARTGR
jgi:hypothetical protein